MSILLLSTGGGGGNILRSVKALFDRDVEVTRRTDPDHADRLQAAVTTCFLDTNEFSISDRPVEERLLIGSRTTGRLGARHDPDVARQALEESKSDIEAVLLKHTVVILLGTGGKGTGAGTIFPLAELARRHKRLVLPVFVRPSFERHEVDKRRYDHALKVRDQFDAAGFRLSEVLNDRGYDETDPQPQHVVWERMNRPIARGLRGLIYVLWDLSQVDPSDLSMLFAGSGRVRIGFGEIDPPQGADPSRDLIEQAALRCWENRYCAFSRPVGTSLVCIHGEWSNLADARIKGALAAAAVAGSAGSPYNPLYTRAVRSPRPWGVTALFSEYTGAHPPLEVDWASHRLDSWRHQDNIPVAAPVAFAAGGSAPVQVAVPSPVGLPMDPPPVTRAVDTPAAPAGPAAPASEPPSSLWEFALAVNRSDPAALAVAGSDGDVSIPMDGLEVRKLLGTMWFRAIVPRLSREWQTRLLGALVDDVVVPDHAVKVGRRTVPISELDYPQLQEVARASWVTDTARADLDLLVVVGRLWGEAAVSRFRFAEVRPAERAGSRLAGLLDALRK